jgi:hypothetical protein
MLVGFFWRPYTGRAVGDEWDMTDLIGGAGERAQTFLSRGNCSHHVLNNLYSSPKSIRMIKSRRTKLAGYVTRMGKPEMHTKIWPESLKGGDHLEDLRVYEWIILKWILGK